MSDIKLGDVVQLKSGSWAMTLDSLGYGGNGDEVKVVWFKEGEVKSAILRPESLKKLDDQ